jgi:hypothetical protein
MVASASRAALSPPGLLGKCGGSFLEAASYRRATGELQARCRRATGELRASYRRATGICCYISYR